MGSDCPSNQTIFEIVNRWDEGISVTKESILVTGGDGNIGSEVIRQLSLEKRNDLRIVGGARSISKSKNKDKGLNNRIG